nr:class I SAM-dependent methyltransferase [uncultured Methanoregula sp.]
MQDNPTDTRSHYDRFLAEQYLWMAGGFGENCRKNRTFFAGHSLVPRSTGNAIDLGAGCGFQSVPLAEAGFRVTAVDFCRPLLAELRGRAGTFLIDTLIADIRNFPAWSSRRSELISCMGDTLTHLPDLDAVHSLIRQCHAELEPGGKCVFSLRDYSAEPERSVVVIPVRRDPDRIFLCRLEHGNETVGVTDILISRKSGKWERTAGTYTKIRIAPEILVRMLDEAGFTVEFFEADAGVITIIAGKK